MKALRARSRPFLPFALLPLACVCLAPTSAQELSEPIRVGIALSNSDYNAGHHEIKSAHADADFAEPPDSELAYNLALIFKNKFVALLTIRVIMRSNHVAVCPQLWCGIVEQ